MLASSAKPDDSVHDPPSPSLARPAKKQRTALPPVRGRVSAASRAAAPSQAASQQAPATDLREFARPLIEQWPSGPRTLLSFFEHMQTRCGRPLTFAEKNNLRPLFLVAAADGTLGAAAPAAGQPAAASFDAPSAPTGPEFPEAPEMPSFKPRVKIHTISPGKPVMSGGTASDRKTFLNECTTEPQVLLSTS